MFFDWNKSDITPQAAAILDNAAEQYRTCGNARVTIAGHADRSEFRRLQRRSLAASCRQRQGLPGWPRRAGRCDDHRGAFGESRPLVETADGVREPQNRRVEITYGPGSGW